MSPGGAITEAYVGEALAVVFGNGEQLGGERTARMPPGIRIRPFKSDDLPLIMKTWLDDYRGSGWSYRVGALYYPTHRLIVDAILTRSEVRVACSVSDEDTIAGWACFEPKVNVVHFVHVKPQLCGGGIARGLLEGFGAGTVASHRGRPTERHPLGVPDGWTFDETKMFWKPGRESK